MTREKKLEAALIALRDQMQTYQDAHMAKEPPQHWKAKTNADMVSLANLALVSPDDDAPVGVVTFGVDGGKPI